MIEVQVNKNGITFVRRKFNIKGLKLIANTEARVTSGPLTNGHFFSVLKAISKPNYKQAIIASGVTLSIKCTGKNDVSTSEKSNCSPVDKSSDNSNASGQQLNLQTIRKCITTSIEGQIQEIIKLLDLGKTLSISTVAYMFDKHSSEVEELFRLISENYGCIYEAGKLLKGKRGIAS